MLKMGVRRILIKKAVIVKSNKKQNGQANSVDPDEMAQMSHLIWIYTDNQDLLSSL